MLDTQSLTALAAIAVVLPLAAGGIDLAVGAEIGFGSILVAALISKAGWSPTAAVPAAVVAGGLVGCVAGLLITRVRIDSLITTLGLSWSS